MRQAYRTTPKKWTNKQRYCECGSGYIPAIMDTTHYRWACRECYGRHYPQDMPKERA